MRLSRATLAAFSAPCLPLAAVGLPVVVYLPPYYTRELGLSLAAVGTIFLVVRLIDIPLDPLIGHLVDRTRGRWGRFRPWLAGGAAVLMAGAFATFMAAPGITPAGALAGLVLMYVGYSAMLVAHSAWGATLTDDYHDRTRVFGWWVGMNLAGMLLVLALPPLVAKLAPGGGAAAGIHAMGWLVVAGAPLTASIAARRVSERAVQSGHAPHLRDLLTVFATPLIRRLLLIDLLGNLAPGITGALFLFYFEAVKGFTTAQASSLLLVYFAAGLAGVPFWTRLARRTSKHRAAVIAFVSYAAMQLGIFLLPPGNWWFAAGAMALAGAPHVAPAYLLRAMLADVGDAETLRTGQEKTGLFYAAAVAVQKLGYAVPVGLTYPLLSAIGFDAQRGGSNNGAALLGITLLFIVPPTIVALIAAWVTSAWPIGAAQQATTAAALRQAS